MMGDSVAYASDSFQLPACLEPASVPRGCTWEGHVEALFPKITLFAAGALRAGVGELWWMKY